MASSIRLGKLFGIEIGINWSLVFVFALITWTVATEVLPIDVPGKGPSPTGSLELWEALRSMRACSHTNLRMRSWRGAMASRSAASRCGCSEALQDLTANLQAPGPKD